MQNQLEYATIFDTDTQQNVVLMRRNKNQKYQKYVYDEKLERFDKLPETVTIHDLVPLYMTKCEKHSEIYFCENKKNGRIYKYRYDLARKTVFRVQCTCCDYDIELNGTYFMSDTNAEFEAAFCALSHALEATQASKNPQICPLTFKVTQPSQSLVCKELVEETTENYLFVRPMHSVICLKTLDVVVMVMIHPIEKAVPCKFDPIVEKFEPAPPCNCSNCSVIDLKYDFFATGNQGAAFQRCHRDHNGLPLICLSIKWQNYSSGQMEIFCDEQGFIGNYTWNEDRQCFDLQKLLEIRVLPVVSEEDRPALIFDDKISMLYTKECDELQRTVYFGTYKSQGDIKKFTYNTLTHQFERVSCACCEIEHHCNMRPYWTKEIFSHELECMLTGKKVTLRQEKYGKIEKKIAAVDGTMIEMKSAPVKDMTGRETKDLLAHYSPPKAVLPVQILESDGTEKWIINTSGSKVFLFGMDGKIQLHRMKLTHDEITKRRFVPVDEDGNECEDSKQKKGEDESENSTPKVLSLPPQDTLTASDSQLFTAYRYQFCPHYNRILIRAKYKRTINQLFLTPDSLIEAECDDCDWKDPWHKDVEDGVIFACQNGFLYKFEEYGQKVLKMEVVNGEYKVVKQLAVQMKLENVECAYDLDVDDESDERSGENSDASMDYSDDDSDASTDDSFSTAPDQERSPTPEKAADCEQPVVVAASVLAPLEAGTDDTISKIGSRAEEDDQESTRTALEPSEFDSNESEDENESYDNSEYSDEEEEDSDGDGKIPEKQKGLEEVQEYKQSSETASEPQNIGSGSLDSKNDLQQPKKSASGLQDGEGSIEVEESSGSNQSKALSEHQQSQIKPFSTPTTVPKLSDDECNDSDVEDESDYDSEYSDEDEEESESEEDASMEKEHPREAENSEKLASGSVDTESVTSDLKNDDQKSTTTTSVPVSPVPATDSQEAMLEASSHSKAKDYDQQSTTTALEPSDIESEESDFEDESDYDSEYSDEEEEEESDSDGEQEEPDDVQKPSETAPGSVDIKSGSSNLKTKYQESTTTASDPSLPAAATETQELKIEASRLIGAKDNDQGSTKTALEPSDDESNESDVEDESYDDSEYSDEEEEESDDDEEQKRSGDAQNPSDAAPGPVDIKSGSPNLKEDHQESKTTTAGSALPGAATGAQKTKVEASSVSKAVDDDQESTKTALEPSEFDSEESDVEDESDYDSDYSDEDEEESEYDEEHEKSEDVQKPSDYKSGSEIAKFGSFDPTNNHPEPTTAASAPPTTEDRETTTTVYHLLAARDANENPTLTALKPDYEGSDAEYESCDDSDCSDKDEEESESDGEESMDQENPEDAQESQMSSDTASGAQDSDQKPKEESGNAQKSGSNSSSGNQENESKPPNASGANNDSSDFSDDDSDGSDVSDEESEYSDEEEEEESDASMDQEHSGDVKESAASTKERIHKEDPILTTGSPNAVSSNSKESVVLSKDIYPFCLEQCPKNRQFVLHAMNLISKKIGAYIIGKDGNLEEVSTPLKLDSGVYSGFKNGEFVIGNGEVNYELDAYSRFQKWKYSEEVKTFVKCEHGVVKMLEVKAQEVLQEDEAFPAKRVSEKSKVNDEDSDSDSENEDEDSEETGDDMEDEEVSDEEDPFVYNTGVKEGEILPSNFDPDESLPAAPREFRFKAPANFLHPVNLNDTANMSDIPLTSPDESLAEAETSCDDSQYCMMTNDDVLLTKRVKDPNPNCCIS